MARLIKEWMKAKKGICSSDCQCLTITGWKCYAEENLCNCWYKSNSNNNSNNNQSAPVAPEEPDTTNDDNSTDNYVEPEIPDDILENSTEESLDDLNS